MSTQRCRSIFISWAAAICLSTYAAYGDYRDVTTKVNVNKQTDLFEKSIEDHAGLQRQLEGQKDAGLKAIQSGNGIDWVTKEGIGEIEKQAAGLSGIKATELNSRGTQEMVKQNAIDELHVDYSKPLNKQHLVDAEKLAKGQNELMRNLLAKLQDIGVDCKTVKGSVEQEPTYYLKVEQTPVKNTVYNKTLCEELRNKYNCQDTLTVKCSKRGTGEAIPGTINFSYSEMPNHWWFGRGGDGGISTGIKLPSLFVQFNTDVLPEVKAKIIEKIGRSEMEKLGISDIEVPMQRIMIFGQQQLFYQLDEQGNKGHIQGVWQPNVSLTGNIRFFFKVVQKAGCQEWQEDWTERCRLQ